MERKVLIAVDSSVNALQAVRYVGRVFGTIEHFCADLLHLIPTPPPILVSEAKSSPRALHELKGRQAKHHRRAQEVLERAREELIRVGGGRMKIETLVKEARQDLARDILDEAENRLYDALVLGRRGLGPLHEIFIGSVSQKCVQEARKVPVWIVDGEAVGPRILVALDGSEDAFRAVDHVGFIAARHPELEIDLFHVSTELAKYCSLEADEELTQTQAEVIGKEKDRCLRSFFARAVRLLHEAGVDRDRITITFRAKGLDAARAILQEAKEKSCGTVVVGRRGISRIKQLFLGSVSARVIQGASHLAVWVIN